MPGRYARKGGQGAYVVSALGSPVCKHTRAIQELTRSYSELAVGRPSSLRSHLVLYSRIRGYSGDYVHPPLVRRAAAHG